MFFGSVKVYTILESQLCGGLLFAEIFLLFFCLFVCNYLSRRNISGVHIYHLWCSHLSSLVWCSQGMWYTWFWCATDTFIVFRVHRACRVYVFGCDRGLLSRWHCTLLIFLSEVEMLEMSASSFPFVLCIFCQTTYMLLGSTYRHGLGL
jgi:hypothetical protein